MTTQGDESSISDRAPGTPDAVRNGARGGSKRRIVAWCGAIAVLGAGGWVVSRPHPGDLLPGLGSTSQDVSVVVGSPAPSSATDPNPFDVNRYFPQSKPVEVNNYKGKRSGARQSGDCNEVLQDAAKKLLKDAGCQGYMAVSISRGDTRVLTSVTVLRFADDGAAAKAAELLAGQGAVVRFVLPDATFAGTPSPAPGAAAKSDPAPKVQAVRHYVTLTSSRFADGHAPVTPQDSQDLDEATRAGSYIAGTAFVWS
ncbi:hypothetical protein E6W39_03465 [Kitasatospora acidiphila]|uniref:Uncharacterized protein n=1 Tax=Kitasatospora acidiphila TaxID=2567942 RepID=A0A540VXI3_9ACTN|nr:hypothetical protein [Kitasatospora acidiphila]TQF01476.1 hypothetical protein E6W39_03465 [Kitasatospora acidiphila]